MTAMRYQIISFTENGIRLSKRIAGLLAPQEVFLATKCSFAKENGEKEPDGGLAVQSVTQSLGDWTREQMGKKNALIFIGACGIVVRAVAPCLTDKLHDNPVLVIDETGKFVIPLLSGHVGGANEIAAALAAGLGATPVITTATDRNHKFAVDLFAKQNNLYIENKEGIAKVSAKALAGEPVTVWAEPGRLRDPDQKPDGILILPDCKKPLYADIVIASEKNECDALIRLSPREYVIGMGCKKGTEASRIEALITETLREARLSLCRIYALASIDVKKEEEGLLCFCEKENIPFLTYTAAQLQAVEGEFHASSFVKEKVGVDNVCERAALKACGNGGSLIRKKRAGDGMTIAVAKREWSVTFAEGRRRDETAYEQK